MQLNLNPNSNSYSNNKQSTIQTKAQIQFKPKIKNHFQILYQPMIESSPAFLKCHECKKSPKQFTFLLCNHIICEKCIDKKIQFGNSFNSVLCSCGSLTYFNEDSEIIEEDEMVGKRVEKERNEFLTNNILGQNQRKSLADQRNSFGKTLSKQTLDQYSKTLINQRSTMPLLQASDVFSLQKNDSSEQKKPYRPSSPQKQRYLQGSLLTTEMRNNLTGTDNTKYDQSLLLDNYQSYEPVGKRDVQPMRTINEFSTHQIETSPAKKKDSSKNLVNPKIMLNEVKTIKESVIVDTAENDRNRTNLLTNKVKQNLFEPHNQMKKFSSPLSIKSHHSQFQSELWFLKIMFQKDVQEIEFQFRKMIDKITQTYHSLQEQLRSLYVEEIITKESFISLNLSSLIKNKYEKVIGEKFRTLKDRLFLPFYNSENKHNQNNFFLVKTEIKNKPLESPLLEAYKLNCKTKPVNNKDSTNSSQVFQDSENDQDNREEIKDMTEKATTMNRRGKIREFETVEEKLERLTTKPRKTQKNRTDLVKAYNQQSSKRIQTENVHTSIKRNHSHQNLHHGKNQNNQNPHIHHNTTLHRSPQPHYRLTQKPTHPNHHHHLHSPDSSSQNPKQIVYYSPPIPYCYKHLQKKQKEARNYISYIEKLCHEKKMKNNQELFKKVKTGYEFGRGSGVA